MQEPEKLNLPENFKNNIQKNFREEGKQWLNRLPEILRKVLKKWNISSRGVGEELSYNLIVRGHSPEYGEVVLKIGFPHSDLFSEMRAISLYEGDYICKCYDKDKELGAMLLERIQPGYNLTNLEDEDEKIKIAADLIQSIPTPVAAAYEEIPCYEDWINRAFEKAREGNVIGERMRSYLNIAEIYYQKLENEKEKENSNFIGSIGNGSSYGHDSNF